MCVRTTQTTTCFDLLVVFFFILSLSLQLGRYPEGMDEDGYGPTSHVAAARAAGFKSPGDMRVGRDRESSTNHHSSSQQQQQHTTTTATTLTTYEEQMQQRRNEQRKMSSSTTQQLGRAGDGDVVGGRETGAVGVGGGTTFVPEGGAGGSWSIARALQVLNSDNRELHSDASEALAEMFAASPPAGVEIIMKGGVGAITNAVEAGHAAFAAGGMALLHMFASSQVTGRRMKADEDVLSGRTPAAVLSAMRRYPNNTAVIQWGAMTLWALAKDNPRCKLAIMVRRITTF